MRFSGPGSVRAAGDLWSRLARNYARLEEEQYRPEHVYQREKKAQTWPGDVEGRTLLAWIALEGATGREARYVEPMLARWPDEVNEHGYFGHDYGHAISEQQLSGHGWMLRALARLDRARPRAGAARLAAPIVERLFLPTRGTFAAYPIDPAGREEAGEYSGTHLKQVGRWILSTDVGCFAIGMAGLIDAHEHFRDERAQPLIEEMIERFLEIDLESIRAQTHATLSGCRGLLTWAEITGDRRFRDAAAERFTLYRDRALTETYANFNWFGRPQWTEPCAVVDSIMVAMELWRTGGADELLDYAQLAWFNALGHGQRANGGFGCDNCPGADGETHLFFRTRESHWCCTMRGSEGLAEINRYQVAVGGDTIVLPIGMPCSFRDGKLALEVESEYPEAAVWTLTNRGAGTVEVELYLPPWVVTDDHAPATGGRRVRLRLAPGEPRRVTGVLADRRRALLPATRSQAAAHDAAKAPAGEVRLVGPLVYASYGDDDRPIRDDWQRFDMEPERSRKRLIR